MKKKLLCTFIFLNFGILFSQVGINTNFPEKELHVNGTMKTRGLILKDNLSKLGASENYSFLVKSPNTNPSTSTNFKANKITTYGIDPNNSPAPINILTFKITCNVNDKDWVKEFDTKINSQKYIVVINSHSFTQLLAVAGNDGKFTPLPSVFASYTGTGTWRLRADYPSSAPSSSSPTGVWDIGLVIIDRKYAKEFNYTQALTSGTGSATAPLVQ